MYYITDGIAAVHVEIIERDITEAQHLPFAEYVAFLAHYGSTLARLANDYDAPKLAVQRLHDVADRACENANRRSATGEVD